MADEPPFPASTPGSTSYDAPVDDGASNASETTARRLISNIWFMVLERKWYAIATFLVCVLAAVAYALAAPRIYVGVATVQILKHGPQVLRVADVVESNITSEADLNTQIKVLESAAIVRNVAKRLTPDEARLLTHSIEGSESDAPNPVDVIFRGRRIIPQRMSMILAVQFQHTDPKIAARIANLIVEEYIAYNSRVRIEESMKAVDELKDRADQQRKRVDDLANALQGFRQRGNLISLQQNKDIVTEKLKALNMMATQSSARLKESEVRWNQVQAWLKAGRDLSDLPFIASQAKVSQLIQQVTSLKLAFSQVNERYKQKHPRWIEAANALVKARSELQLALGTAAASVKAEYENAFQVDEEARKALAEQEARSLDIDKSSVEYENLQRDFRINDQLLESMISRMRETSVSSSIETESARVIDRAYESAVPISPNVRGILAGGILAGIFFGLGLAYGVAALDDGIKTTLDVEKILRLPLMGAIPRVVQMDQPDKAQIVANGLERETVEAFLSLYSNVRISETGRKARLILVTSTLPGEGKSFIATNLALTFASQGQRTVIVDCDLRKPNVENSFRLRPAKGLINFCAREVTVEEVITRDVRPNLDVIAAGGRSKNPILLLNSPEFEALVAELERRYDRVIFDTPPLGAVSDALNVLRLVDGWIYAIRFNKVKLGAALQCTRRMLATQVPPLGAVLNDMNSGSAGDHYLSKQSRSFKEYYALSEAGDVTETS